jgi:hypothetical protein
VLVLDDEDADDAEEVVDDEPPPLDSFFADPLDEPLPPEDAPARLSVR